MTDYVLTPSVRPSLPVIGSSARFAVRRIYCVGRNYAAHRREMGSDNADPPFFFMKPADALVPPGQDAPYPSLTQNLHHEVELVAALGAGGADVPVADALDLVWGYAVGVDLTRRDLQAQVKAKGQPWEAAKAFDASAPVGAIRPVSPGDHPAGAIRLSVNGQARQTALLTDMIWSVAEIIAQASRLWRLEAGDLIFTGTPEGVGPVAPGDQILAQIEGVGETAFRIA